MAEKVIIDIEIDGNKALNTLNDINNEIKLQTELLNKAKIGSEEYTNAAGSVTKLKGAKKDLTDEMNKAEKARQKENAAMAKQKEQMDKLYAAATKEVKTEQDLIDKKNALNTIRRKFIDKTSKEGAAAYDRLTDKVKAFNTSLIKSDEKVNEHNRKVGDYPNKMGAATTSTGGFTKGLAAMAIGITAAIAVVQKFSQQIGAAVTAFLTVDKVNQQVTQSFGAFSDEINKNADLLERTTAIEAEQYQRLAVSAKSYGAANKDVNAIVVTSIGLAKQFELQGVSQEQAMKALVKAQNGQYAGLEKIYPALKNVTDETEKMRIVQELAAEGMNKAIAYTDTYSGKLDLIQHSAGTLQETFGEGIVTGIMGSPAEMNQFIDAIETINSAFQDTQFIPKMLGELKDVYMSMWEPIDKLLKTFGLATDAGGSFSFILQAIMKVFQFMLIPTKAIWSVIGTLVDTFIYFKEVASGVKELNLETAFELIKTSVSNLLSPVTDLIGLTDDLAAAMGIQSEQIGLSAEKLAKLNVLSGDYIKNTKEAAKLQVELNAIEAENLELEEEKKAAIEAANKAYQDHLNKLKEINEQYEFSTYFAKNRNEQWEAEKVRITALLAEYQRFLAADGWTDAELEKFAAYKAQLTTDLENVKTQLFDFNMQINEMLALTPMQILPSKEELEKQLAETKTTIDAGMSAWQSARNEEEKARQDSVNDDKEAWEQRRDIAESTAAEFGNILAASIDETGFNLQKFGKMYTQFILDQMQKVVYASIAEITAREFATKGLAGAVTAGLINASVIAAFQVAKSLVARSGSFADGGFTGHGGKYEPAGTVHKGEVVFSQADVAALGGAHTVDAMRPTSKQNYFVGGIVGSVPQPVNSSAMLLDALRQIRPVVTVQDINAVAQSEINRQQIAVI